jgi:hypothetical protein
MATPVEPPPSPPGRPGGEEPRVPASLRTAAAYAWRIIAVGVVVRVAFSVLGQFHRIAVAVFLGLVIAAVLRPAAGLLARFMPRPLAVAVAIVGGIVLVLVLGDRCRGGRTAGGRGVVRVPGAARARGPGHDPGVNTDRADHGDRGHSQGEGKVTATPTPALSLTWPNIRA